MNLKRTAVALLCAVILLVSGAVPEAFADWYDNIESGTWVEIKGQNFVADTFMGVKAYYNESGNSVYHCGEVIERFYREAFGLDVEIRSSEPRLRMNTPGYKLVTPYFPKAGDVVFVSSEMRGGKGDHWAIVKYYEDGYLVLFEQNVIHNGCAGINRRLKYPSDSYYIFSPVAVDGGKDPVLNGADKPSQTSASTTEKVTETTTKPTTEKPTTTKLSTTEKPTTTKPTATKPTTTKPTTTKKITTTAKPTTTKKVTTTKAVTTTKPTTTVPETAIAVSTTAEETTTAWYYTYTYTSRQTETEVYSSVEYTETPDEESNRATLPLAIVCGVLACGVAALVVLLIKKKK